MKMMHTKYTVSRLIALMLFITGSLLSVHAQQHFAIVTTSAEQLASGTVVPIDGGCIISGDQGALYNTVPPSIYATTASGGACNGQYNYQWQYSTDNIYFTDIGGATAQNLVFSTPLLQTTYFQRKVTCGAEVKFAGPVRIIITSTLYYNAEIRRQFTRNNCSNGTLPGTVVYIVPANTYTSMISQADADQKAQNDVTANGQAYANANGTCSQVYLNRTTSGTFTRECSKGYVGSTVTYTVPASTYTSIISQADADQKAQNNVNTNGQAYANQNGRCDQEYYNVAKSGSFVKNNCSSGYTGSAVTYAVDAGMYTSMISQADADQKAQNDVNTNGQAYANQNGSCSQVHVYYNVAKSGSFTRSNCGPGSTASTVIYTVASGSYTSLTSQADADQKAQNDVNINGPTYANQNGICTETGCNASNCSGNDRKCINGVCEVGNLVIVSSVYKKVLVGGLYQWRWVCTRRFCFSNGSVSSYFEESYNTSSCPVQSCFLPID